ncbi:hypothetical protein EYS42_11760 [Aquabacterium lacunae]|uniref:Uncharacterized protein n=1 Tax=Aquabacterium lacunae TaxID=2528630 RepID=A0A4V6MTR1_9BURK|nr:beta-galactosidase [Aquabacterium lacunae]TBO30360.1 hypothetical protein EYS42_11760 [Aquabacterium lacunae]
MRVSRVLCWLVLGLSLWQAQAAASAGRMPALGINVLWGPGDDATLQQRFQKVRRLGLQEVRIDWEWRIVEKQKGKYDWRALDRLVNTAHKEGVRLLPIVHYAPAWALPDLHKADDVYELAPSPDHLGDYARFLKASIERYGPQGNAPITWTPITHWQVWNEPNVKMFWGPKPDARAFTALYKVVHEHLRPVRARIQLVHAGLAKPDIEFMWQLWEANPAHGETFDVMAVHSYLFHWWDGIREAEAMDKDDRKASAMGFVGSIDDPGFLGKVFNIQLFMTLRKSGGKPIWITEMGYFVSNKRLGVDEAGQARRLQQDLSFVTQRLTDRPYGTGARSIPTGVQRVYWFALEDYPSPDGMGSFGVYRPDGSLRPAGDALRRLTQRPPSDRSPP